jgi:DMSO/TMAO reductase YedYZ molybdopterin-dependent catalytic subunit
MNESINDSEKEREDNLPQDSESAPAAENVAPETSRSEPVVENVGTETSGSQPLVEKANPEPPSEPPPKAAEEVQNSTGLEDGPSKVETKKATPFITVKDCLVEQAPKVILRPRKQVERASRRDFLIYGAGMAGAVATFGWLLPDQVKTRLGLGSKSDPVQEKFLRDVLKFDDSVAQGLFSKNRLVPTYTKAEMTDVPNNYAGETPNGAFIPLWTLLLSGLAEGADKQISSRYLKENFAHHEQITRLVCVEGWSAISGWGGIRFADLIKAFPPKPNTKWIQLRSEVNLDGDGNSDPYFVSLDIDSALHPQTLLVTHHNGQALELEHGAPLRLLAPMKLGLKNIKAITSITYSEKEPDDYWNKDGYSYYDGI